MINISLQISQRMADRLKGDIRLFESYLQQLSGELMKQEAGLTALAAIKFQAPIPSSGGRASGDGLGVAAKKQGEVAVERDIRKIFRSADVNARPQVLAFAGSMENFIAWKSQPFGLRSDTLRKIHADGDVVRAFDRIRKFIGPKADEEASLVQRRTYVGPGEMRGLHDEQRRIYRGRLYKHGGPTREVKMSPYVIQESAIKRYVKERQKRVGWMKAGWAKVIERIGMVNVNGRKFRPAGGKVPMWVKRHAGGGGGRLNLDFTASRKRVQILNESGNVDGIALSWDVARKVIDFRNVSISSRPYQSDMDKAVSLWNQGRIKLLS